MDLPDLSKRVDGLFGEWSSTRGTPGAAVRVIRDGRVIHSGHYGLADIETKTPIDTQTSFLLASLTKQFTAVSIMILVERGDLGYDQRLSEFFPTFPDYARRITIRQLLLHTSGLREFDTVFVEAGVIRKDDKYPRSEESPRSPIEPTSAMTREYLSRQLRTNFEPGGSYEYSNSGYVILAQIVEAVSGKSFPDFVKRNLFEPAGMLDSVIPVENWRTVANRAKSYSSESGNFKNSDYTPLNLVYGEDGIYTTIEDMVRWDHALHSAILVRQSTLAEAFAPGKLNDGSETRTGFGWFVGPDFVDHAGGWAGFNTYICRYRSRRFTIVVLANCKDIDAATVGQRIADIYWDGQAGAVPPGSVVTRPPAGKQYHGVFPGFFDCVGDDLEPKHLDEYEKDVGKKVAIVYFSNEWWRKKDAQFPKGDEFPEDRAAWIRERNAVPFIRLMLRTSPEDAKKEPEKKYTLDHILEGNFDKPLRAWAEKARKFGTPLLVEYGTECNGDWMPWNGAHNGDNGPQKFRAVFRHIVRLMTPATNIRWVFHVNGDDNPKKDDNRLELYYPGDDVVDWLAVSCYGAQSPSDTSAESFESQMNTVYARLEKLAPSKPVYVAEFGCIKEIPKVVDPCLWTKDALRAILGRGNGKWENLIGFSWWNSGWTNPGKPNSTMLVHKIDNLDKLPEVFQAGLDDPRVQVDPVIR